MTARIIKVFRSYYYFFYHKEYVFFFFFLNQSKGNVKGEYVDDLTT